MKTTLRLSAALLLLASSLTACDEEDWDLDDDDNVVTLYSDTNFRGKTEQWSERNGRCRNVPDKLNDRVSSIACAGNIIVFEHEDCSGPWHAFTCNVADLHEFDWADRISSVRY